MVTEADRIVQQLTRPVSILPLVVLRVVLGVLLYLSMLRFVLKGWVHALYGVPSFHFTYPGFGWVVPLPTPLLTSVYLLLAVLGLCIAAGCAYRLSMGLFCLLFTYTELLDSTYYLNHYYFVSLFTFLLLWLPLHRAAALDVRRRPACAQATVPVWMLWAVQGQLALVYVFAGIAKLNPDWLLHALPLRIWLQEQLGVPGLGFWLGQGWVAYVMSWGGLLFDLTIPLWLQWRRTRPLAYLMVVCFHALTGWLFPIGMFPLLMIGSTLVFFDTRDYAVAWHWLQRCPALRLLAWNLPDAAEPPLPPCLLATLGQRLIVTLFLLGQLVIPLRHWGYAGDVLWNEAGFRFSWRVMLVEKTGSAMFVVADPVSGKWWHVYPEDMLTKQQAKQMAFQPDLIHMFAQHLARQWQAQGYPAVQVYAEVWVSLNGRPAHRLVDPTVDLAREPRRIGAPRWVLPRPPQL